MKNKQSLQLKIRFNEIRDHYYYLISKIEGIKQTWQIFFHFLKLFFQPKKVDKKDPKGGKGTKAAAALPGKKAGGKAKKKSWTKAKVKEKLNNAVFVDQKAYERISKDAAKF